jgi:predicted membrane-bound spermidine synthase
MGRNPAVFFQGRFLLGALLLQACAVAFILILLPPWIFRREKSSRRGTFKRVFLYFGLIGAAFIFIEIILIQRFTLFLGQPLYSVSIVISSLLFSSGLGSLCSLKILGEEPARKIKGILLLCAGLTAFYLILLSAFFHGFLGFGPGLKMAAAFMIIFPLGFLMGMPFPTGIRLLKETDRRLLPWAWSTNAFSTVIGAILAQGLALSLGYNAVWSLAAGAYLAVFFLLCFTDHRNKADA